MNDRKRPFLPGEPKLLSRTESMLQAVAAVEQRRAEKARADKQKPPIPGKFDPSAQARDRLSAREMVLKQLERELLQIELAHQEKQRRRAVVARAKRLLARR
jgi:hypothetical protein